MEKGSAFPAGQKKLQLVRKDKILPAWDLAFLLALEQSPFAFRYHGQGPHPLGIPREKASSLLWISLVCSEDSHLLVLLSLLWAKLREATPVISYDHHGPRLG
jgi:hypothetical protein